MYTYMKNDVFFLHIGKTYLGRNSLASSCRKMGICEFYRYAKSIKKFIYLL